MLLKSVVEALVAVMLVPLLDQLMGLGDNITGVSYTILRFAQALSGVDDTVLLSFLILVGLSITRAVVGVGFNYVNYAVLSLFERDKRNILFKKLMYVDWLYYLAQRGGYLINTMTVEVIKSRQVFGHTIRLLDASLSVLIYFVAAIYISPIYIVAIVLIVILLALVMIPVFRRVKAYGARLVKGNQELMQQLNELVSGFKVVKGSGMEEVGILLVEEKTFIMSQIMLRAGFLKKLLATTLEPLTLIAILGLVYVMQSYQLGRVSELGAIVFIFLRSFQRLTNLQTMWVGISENLTSFGLTSKQVAAFEKHKEQQGSEKIEQFETLALRHLFFRYDANREILKDINLEIKRGEFIGIVGGSGAGKTTLVDLILSLLKPTAGDLLVNARSLDKLDPYHWRGLIGYVPQETMLFNDTVLNNITLRREGITLEEVHSAAKLANADEFIRELPHDYQTVIGDRGSKLSGGQRQRLALARALVRQPAILLLDEATSSLDTFSEQKIQKAVERLRGELTIVVVAHRLSTVMNADQIVVMEQGQILEIGTPQELVRRDGKFAEMIALQMRQELE